jgi:hypothetical protein
MPLRLARKLSLPEVEVNQIRKALLRYRQDRCKDTIVSKEGKLTAEG